MQFSSFLLLLLAPLLFAGFRFLRKEKQQTKKQKALALAYYHLVVQSRIAVEQRDILGNRVFAIDKRNKKLVVVDHNEPGKQEVCIPLLSVGEARIIEEKKENGKLRKLFLELRHKKTNLVHRICFYDERHDQVTDLPHHCQKIQHWKTRVDLHKNPGSLSLGGEFVL